MNEFLLETESIDYNNPIIQEKVLELKKYGTVEKWLNIKMNQILTKNKAIKFDPTILAFSKTFIDFCDKF